MEKFLEFAGNNTLLVLALTTSFFLVVFTELRRKAGNVASLGAASAVRLINNDAVVIDLRSAESFSRGHIVNARNVPFDELDGHLGKLESLKSKPVIAVCDAGITSKKALETLKKAGFESAYILADGMTGWSRDGLPIVSSKKTGRKK